MRRYAMLCYAAMLCCHAMQCSAMLCFAIHLDVRARHLEALRQPGEEVGAPGIAEARIVASSAVCVLCAAHARGTMPRSGDFFASSLRTLSGPNMVWVLPEPVCPYATIVALKPWRTRSTPSLPTFA